MKQLLKYPLSFFITLIYTLSWLINFYLLKIKDFSDSPGKGFVAIYTIGSVIFGLILLISFLIALLIAKNKITKKSYSIFFIIVLGTFIFDLLMT